MLLYLTRHGETDWNNAGRWQGHTDVPLNPKGYTQARAIGEALKGAGLSAVVSSDLLRARETARVAAQVLGVPHAYEDPGLRERAFGPFEGLTREECLRLHPDAWRAWVEEQRAPAGAEGRKELALRVTAAIGRAVEWAESTDARLLIVTHGGSLRAAIVAGTGVLPAPVANGAIWQIEWAGRIVSAEPLPLP
jgi:broad specificity phosphatase PhoE